MAILRFACQACDRTISAPTDLAGKKARCPRCKAVVLVPDQIDDQDGNTAESSTSSHEDERDDEASEEQSEKNLTDSPSRFSFEVVANILSLLKDVLFHRIYVPPKAVRLIFYVLLHPGLIMIPTVSTVVMVRDSENSSGMVQLIGGSLCCAGSIWLLIGFYPAWILARYISVPFVRVLRCPNCDFETDAVDVWSAGGYNDYRERHVLLWRNPLDGSRISHKNCPMCETTILIQERWPLEHWWMP